MAADVVRLIECPRDAWQGLPKIIPAATKADYLRALASAGFRHIDAVSFVSPEAVPQMADSEAVLASVDLPEDVEIIGIVVNRKGAERAVATGRVSTLGFPYSVSPEFLRRNQRQSPEEALDVLEAVGEVAYRAGLGIVVYISMAFGNPYGDPWTADETAAACDLIMDMNIDQISLADTVGLATAEDVGRLAHAVRSSVPETTEIGVHLHTRVESAAAKVQAAYEAGIRRFDTAMGGLGGCPFAGDVLVGNLPTSLALAELARLGAAPPALSSLEALEAASREIARRFGAADG